MSKPKRDGLTPRQRELAQWLSELRHGVKNPTLRVIHSAVSALDIISPIVESMHRPDLFVWSWTIGIDQAKEILNWQKSGRIGSVWVITDTSFKKRLPLADEAMSKIKGGISYASTHCKVYIVKSQTAYVSILSSANLNKNKRYEFYSITPDRGINEYLLTEFRQLYEAGKQTSQP